MSTDLKRIDDLIKLAQTMLETKWTESGTVARHRVNRIQFAELRGAGLSLIQRLYDSDHPFYREFDSLVREADPACVESAVGILKAIRSEQV